LITGPNFFVFGLLFLEKNLDGTVGQFLVSESGGVPLYFVILYAREEAWRTLSAFRLVQLVSSTFLVEGPSILFHGLPWSSLVFAKGPGDPRDLLVLGNSLTSLFSYHAYHELLRAVDIHYSGEWSGFLLRSDLTEHKWTGLEIGLEFENLILFTAIDLGLASFDQSTIVEGMLTFFDDHVRNGLSGVWSIEVRPFLHLPFERASSDILDSDSEWVTSIERWSSHDHDRAVEHTLDFDSVPNFLALLISFHVTVFDDGITFDREKGSILVEVLSSEKFPFTIVDLEFPFNFSIAAAFSTVELEDVISVFKLSTEVIDLGVLSEFFGSRFSSHVDRLSVLPNDLSIKHGETTFISVKWHLEAVLGTVVTNWEFSPDVICDILFLSPFILVLFSITA
jgi:hypothetical protein